MKNALLFSMLILLFACQEKTAKQAEKQAIETPKLKETKDFTKKQTDFFVDSTQVAQKGKYKVELEQFHDSVEKVNVRFYQKDEAKNWLLVQEVCTDKEMQVPLIAQIEDFNGDKLNDVMFHIGSGARGANSFGKLFLFDAKTQKLIYIRNSDNLPSIEYVKSRNCLTACEYAGNYDNTLFLVIEGDSLREFANVSTKTDADGTSAYAYKKDKKGKSVFLQQKKYKSNDKSAYRRYIDFQPIKE